MHRDARASRLLFLCALAASALSARAGRAQGARPDAPSPAVPSPAPAPSAPAGDTAPVPPTEPARGPLLPVAPSAPPVAVPPIDPSRDGRQLTAQASERPGSESGLRSDEVFSEDWWSRARPILELHGYFRTRAELLQNFALGRHDPPGGGANLWPQPLDNTYTDIKGNEYGVILCGDASSANTFGRCYDKSQATANLRLRLNPELHVSDNLRVLAQVDALDNLVLGSTPDSYALRPAGGSAQSASGYVPSSSGFRYAPIGALTTTQVPPTAGVNGYRNSIDVKRVWAEYMSPLGQIRFGRMPFHWGLGMVYNAGDGLDSDFQTTVDRIQVITGIKALDLYFGGSWDFVSTGVTNGSPYDANGGQPVNLANLANVGQWTLMLARRKNPELQRLSLSRGEFVLNGGLLAVYRTQQLDVAASTGPATPQTQAQTPVAGTNNGFERRGFQSLTPDVWVQALWQKLRIEAEFAAVIGSIEQTPDVFDSVHPVKIRQYGLTTQAEYRAVEDKLRLGFGFGWASGDPWVASLNPGDGWQTERNGGRGPISTFRFNPDYRVDLIFFRRILSRVEGAYYFRPSVDYDFIRNPNGQKFGGGAAIIWSRASEFVQTPGHKRDLGVELDFQLYFQAKDGSLNDNPSKIGGFFTMLQYGVFFPLGGLDYLPGEVKASPLSDLGTSSAQTVRLFLGVAY